MKKFLLILLILAILLSIGLAIGLRYLNTTYLPKVIKTKIIQEAPQKFNLNIGIGDIEFNLLKGIVLHNVEISSLDDPDTKLQIDSASATFLIMPLFNQKKIIFPTVNIHGLKFDIIRYPDNKFNFQKLIPKQIKQSGSSLPYSFLIYRVDVFDSNISFLDKTIEPNIKREIKLKNLGAQIDLWSVDFRLAGELTNENQTSALSLSGSFKFETKELKISSRLDKLNILPFLAYFKELPINMQSFLLNNIVAECVLLDDNLSIEINADATGVNLSTGAYLIKDKTLINDATAKIKASLLLNIKDLSSFDYVVNVDELKADVITPRIPEKVKIEFAKLKISPDKVDIKNSILNTLQTKFIIKGSLENFSDPVFNIRLQSNVDLPIAKDFLRTYFDAINHFIVDGKANLSINFIKSEDKKDIEFKGSLDFENASVKILEAPYEISSINGSINFQKDKVDWSNLSFNLLDKLFYSKATILNLISPSIDLELYSNNINLRTKLTPMQKNSFYIEYLHGSYFNSKIDSSGTLEIKDKENYYVNLEFDSIIDIEDLKQIEAIPEKQLSQISSKSKFKIEGKIKGNINNPKMLDSLLNLNIDELTISGYKIEDLQMQLAQDNQQIKIPRSTFNFYGGTLSINGLMDLEKKTFPYAIKIIADNVDIAKLKLDVPIEDENLRGIIFFTAILSGQMDSIQDFKAQGEILIQDGYLWGFNPLKKLGDFLFIPKYETLVFREASGSFSIADKKIALKDVVLNSDALLLSCEGTIDFMGNLDIDLTPKAVTDMTENLDEFEKFFVGIFSESGGLVTIKVTGTTKNPKFQKSIIAMQVIDKVAGEVGNKIKAFTDLIFGTPQENP